MDKQAGFPTSDTPLYGTGYNQYALDGEVYDREFLDKLYNFWRQKKIEDELLNALNHLDLFPDQESYAEDEFAERRNALMTKLTPLWNMYDTAQCDLAYDERSMDELIKEDVETLLAGKELPYA